jgi:hypothetical protein
VDLVSKTLVIFDLWKSTIKSTGIQLSIVLLKIISSSNFGCLAYLQLIWGLGHSHLFFFPFPTNPEPNPSLVTSGRGESLPIFEVYIKKEERKGQDLGDLSLKMQIAFTTVGLRVLSSDSHR